MFGNTRLTDRLLTGFVVLLVLLGFSISNVFAQDTAQVQPYAGTWTTLLLESVDQFPIAAPPDEAATAAEIEELMALVGERDEDALWQIAYWNSGAPSYRWNQLAMDAMLEQAMAANIAFRDLALLNVAIYDATVAAWNGKYTYNRPRPSEVEPTLETVIPNPASPSYPSEYAVTAGAASTVLAWLFPDKAELYEAQAEEVVNSRLLAGVEYPSDVQAGLELGRQVAELTIERGASDGMDAEWTGSVPTEPGHWTGENPIFPMAARAYALVNIAGNDAGVACWDAKYTYWSIRPFQLDPEFSTLFTTPNHPSYPSAHSCISTATAEVLANQATEARIWAGIHFRSDVEAGITLGENVANAVLAHVLGTSPE